MITSWGTLKFTLGAELEKPEKENKKGQQSVRRSSKEQYYENQGTMGTSMMSNSMWAETMPLDWTMGHFNLF